ncbi:RNA-binding protein 45 [Rhineura floridana]|uniref:RNA-binding protein 45 n=1 Tax=Rhineura floridana TaxID=261503 RepID=UPI002AC86990|nr:RNA-binding protein 45 [Rhineura floridana]
MSFLSKMAAPFCHSLLGSETERSCLPVSLVDTPPYSRLYVLLGKDVVKEEILDHFAPFGDIQNILVLWDKRTQKPKGIVYIKYALSSQACRAMEEMNGKRLSPSARPMKVFMAQGIASGKANVDIELLTQICIVIPNTFTEKTLRDVFKVYGNVICIIVRNNVLPENKVLAYIRFSKAFYAALAIEECDKNTREAVCPLNQCLTSVMDWMKWEFTYVGRGCTTPEDPGSQFGCASGFGSEPGGPGLGGIQECFCPVKTGPPTAPVSGDTRLDEGYQAAWVDVKITPLESWERISCVNSPKEQTNRNEVQGINLITLGPKATSTEHVTKPPESHEHEFCVSSTKQEINSLGTQRNKSDGCRTTLSKPMTKPPEYHEHEHCVSSFNQETNSHEICGSSLLASEQPPDLASLERSGIRSQESVSRRLLVISQFPFEQEQLSRLFDIIPGLESCETHWDPYNNSAHAVIQYSNGASAIYAKYKLQGFEYPFGNRLVVQEGCSGKENCCAQQLGSHLARTICAQAVEQLPPLKSTEKVCLIAQMATELVTLQLPSIIEDNNLASQLLKSSQSSSPSPQLQTDTERPSNKRKAPFDSSVRERLFIMFNPHPLPQDVLDDVLSQFGNFINIYLIPGGNVGYAMFADKASASNAIAALHGKTVNGVKLKVVLADSPTEDSSKRQRTV